MTDRLSKHLAFFLFLFAPALCDADTRQYPFKLSYQGQSGKQIIFAQNNGFAPILATINLRNPDQAIIDHASPIIVVVNPQESVQIVTVQSAHPRMKYRISTAYNFSIGIPDAIQDPAVRYRLPFKDGQAVLVGQAPGGHMTTHNGSDSQYAIDFDVAIGTPVAAARAGRVVDVDENYTQGGNNPTLHANHVLIAHEDGTLGIYSHLSAHRINVALGDKVEAGDLLGYSGNTGYSTGPHLHFAVLTNTRTPDGSTKYRSIPVEFVNGSPAQTLHLSEKQQLIVESDSPNSVASK